MARAVLVTAALLRVHGRQLVGLTDLFEHPQNPSRPPRMLSVKDVQHRADDIRLQRCCGTLGTLGTLALGADSESPAEAAENPGTRAPSATSSALTIPRNRRLSQVPVARTA